MNKVDEFKENLLNNLEYNLEEGNIEDALDNLRRFKISNKNIGYDVNRLNYNRVDLENAFHTKWLEENLPRAGLNSGGGILQDLMTHHKIEVTDRERKIVASVVQWFGTNCGSCFLEETLALVNRKVIDKDGRN